MAVGVAEEGTEEETVVEVEMAVEAETVVVKFS